MKGCLNKGLIIFLFTGMCIAVAYYFNTKEKALPVLSPRQVNPLLVDKELRDRINHKVSGFQFTDQEGNSTDSLFVQGKIHVADFFFTTCQTICPIMTGKMGIVQERFKENENVRFLSFSVLPEQDSASVLSSYASAYEIPYNQWRLLTGERKDIYSLARRSYFTLKPAETGQGDGGMSDFIHTNNFVLVDDRAQIRGYYDGTSDLEMDRLTKDIKSLLKEFSQPK
jgi:protein SCO1